MAIKKLCPFKIWTLENFPFIEDDFDAITNYELLCKIVEYLKKIGSSQKEVIDAVNSLQSFVSNYFENLDVQEEINNKLDEMAESGELTDIIAQYLELAGVLAYDTVADMKSATNIANGSILKTLGYHTLGDGGSATYKVRQVTNEDVINEMTLIALADVSLVAELIVPNPINPLVFGAYGDGVHDDHDIIEYCFNLLNSSNKELDFVGRTYAISEPIIVSENISNSIIKNGTIKALSSFTGDYIIEFPGDFESVTVPNTNIHVLDSIVIDSLYLDCNNECSGIKLVGFLKFKFNNITVWNYTVYGIETTRSDAHELILSNSFIFTSEITGTGIDIHNNDNMFNNIVICGGNCGIKLNAGIHCNQLDQIHIYGIYADNTYNKGIILENGASNNMINNIYFDGCCLYSKCSYGVELYNSLFLECKKNVIVFDTTEKLGNIIIDKCYAYYITSVSEDDTTYTIRILNNTQYNVSKFNKADITVQGSGYIYNNVNSIAIDDRYNFINLFNISDSATKYEFGGSGAYLLDNPQTGYTTEVLNNVIYTTEENNPGYHWCGFLVNLDKNTDYLITDLLRNNIGNIQIVGADDLTAGTKTIIASGSNSIEYLKFNSGNYDYIFIIYYGKINIAPYITKIN